MMPRASRPAVASPQNCAAAGEPRRLRARVLQVSA
jgi:hypothetical protein